MMVDFDFGGQCPDGVNTYLHLQDYAQDSDQVLLYGINSTINDQLKVKYINTKRKVLLDLWSPCAFVGPNDVKGNDHFGQMGYFDQVYSICPYTVKWTNQRYGIQKMKYCFYPLRPIRIQPRNKVKQYDVCFVGGVHSRQHSQRVGTISKYNHLFITQAGHSNATHRNLPNIQKVAMMAKAKIGLCYNLLYLRPQHIRYASAYYKISQHQAFKMYQNFILPQFKSRVNQFALCKTLILCKKDPWNIIQDYYTPGEDFIYFQDNSQLQEKIDDILENYRSYGDMIERAYQKVHAYTSQNLMEMIRNGDKFK